MADVHGSEETISHLAGLLGDLGAVCLGMEPEDLLARHAGKVIELGAAMERYLAGMRTLAVYRAVESKIWRDEGARSPQHWLASKMGCTVAQAARIVATAERVQDQPKTKEALRGGELSDDEADAVSGATEAEPDKEAEHLGAATGRGPGGDAGSGDDGGGDDGGGGGRRASIDELRKRRERAKARADRDAETRAARVHRERTAQRGSTFEGGFQMSMRNTKAAGLRFGAAWDTHIRALQQERKAQGLEPLTYGQVCADALIRMADRSLSDGGGSGGPGGPSMRGILFADVAALKRGVLEGDETCEIAGVGTASVPAARELLGDAVLALVIRDGVDVVHVTHLGPTFTAAQRTAIWARAGGVCEIPACTVTTGLEIDHDHEVQFGGPSDIANASLKCWNDHQDKTHRGRRLVGPPGRRAWVHVDDLPADPARQHVPLDDIEHLLPPLPTRPTGPTPPPGGSRAGPAPPPRPATPRADSASQPAQGEQLDLLTT